MQVTTSQNRKFVFLSYISINVMSLGFGLFVVQNRGFEVLRLWVIQMSIWSNELIMKTVISCSPS